MTLILHPSKKRRPDHRPACEAITSRRQRCQFCAVAYVGGMWVCRHHQTKEAANDQLESH